MYRFSVKMVSDILHKSVWDDTGFVCIGREEPFEQADVIIIAPDDSDKLASVILAARPKVFIIAGRYELPQHVKDLYTGQHWRLHHTVLTIGTFLEVPLAEPVWEAYPEQQEKAIADTIYRHLLNDVFRETAEWCGHMSSVVRPM